MEAKTNSSTEREIHYSRETKDYDAYLGGQYVGSYRTYHGAEIALDELALELVSFARGWDAAAELAAVQVAQAETMDAIHEAQDVVTAALVNWNS